MFWRVELYQQTTIVEVTSKGLLAIAIADEPEQRFSGGANELKQQIESLGIQCQHKESNLLLTTYGVPFVADSPGFKITTQIEEDWALIQSPSVFSHNKVWAYYQELSKTLESLQPWDVSRDRLLYPEFRQYYQKLITALAPELDADKIRSESRHELCVCTPPEEHNGQLRLGLSGVMQLLGYKPAAATGTKTEFTGADTTGLADDPVLALIADCTLIFKRQSEMLFKQFGVADLSQIAGHASKRLEAARAESDASHQRIKEPPPPPKNEKWEEMREDAIAKLSKLDIPLPKKM